MAARPKGVLQSRPEGLSRWAVVAFYPDYGADHPLWIATGLADLDALHLPDELVARLRAWAEYWNARFHWDDGWAAGSPEQWWTEEQDRLPRDLAAALGRELAVAVDGGFIHSRAPASCPSAARAVAAYVDEHEERHRQRAQQDRPD